MIIKRNFTFMEIMVAAVILAMSVVSVMAILGGARSSLLRGENRWAKQHILAQAAEYYLLAGPGQSLPYGILPEGYSSSCEVYQVDDVHEDAAEADRGWLLAEYHIVVYDTGGTAMAETRVRKVLKEEDLE